MLQGPGGRPVRSGPPPAARFAAGMAQISALSVLKASAKAQRLRVTPATTPAPPKAAGSAGGPRAAAQKSLDAARRAREAQPRSFRDLLAVRVRGHAVCTTAPGSKAPSKAQTPPHGHGKDAAADRGEHAERRDIINDAAGVARGAEVRTAQNFGPVQKRVCISPGATRAL